MPADHALALATRTGTGQLDLKAGINFTKELERATHEHHSRRSACHFRARAVQDCFTQLERRFLSIAASRDYLFALLRSASGHGTIPPQPRRAASLCRQPYSASAAPSQFRCIVSKGPAMIEPSGQLPLTAEARRSQRTLSGLWLLSLAIIALATLALLQSLR